MNKNNKGFTIIELMIAIAIVGILAALAIPAYNNYLNRSKASEAFTMAVPYKIAIAECLQNGNNSIECKSSEKGIPTEAGGRYGNIKALDGAVNYQFNNTDAKLKGTIVQLKAIESSGTISWSCAYKLSADSAKAGIDATIFPSSLSCNQSSNLSY
ncbi:MAG: pilin [Burkholderiales bacterium]|nr:pilin [Burkholderiales bacterium]